MHRTRSVDLVPHHHHRWSYRGAVRSQKIRDSDGLLCGLHTHSEPIVQFQVMSSMNGSHHGMSEHHQKFMTRICMNEAELWHETNPTIPYLLRCDTLDRHQVNTTRDHLCSDIFSVLCVVALPANDALHLRFLCGDCFYQPQPPKTLCQESESCLTWLEVESLSCCSTEKQTRHFIYTKLSRSATLRSTSWASHLNRVLICPVPVCPWGERDTLAYCLLTLSTVTPSMCSVGWGDGVAGEQHPQLLQRAQIFMSLFGKVLWNFLMWCGDSRVTSVMQVWVSWPQQDEGNCWFLDIVQKKRRLG